MFFKAVSKEQIERALSECEGNRRRAAKVLGLSPETLYTKVRQLGIEMPPVQYCWMKPQRLDFLE